MEFYDGFTWAVPKAFKDAIASCSFREGDTLFSSKLAYGAWTDEVVDKVDCEIQVCFPNRRTQNKAPEDKSSKFKTNWNTTVKLEFKIDKHSHRKEKFVTTTQGRLFQLLRKGKIEILNTDTESPNIPLLINSLNPLLNDKRITESILQITGNKFNKQNLTVMTYDETSEVSVNKLKSIRSLVSKFNYEEFNFPITEFNFLDKYDFHPVLTIKAIVIDSTLQK